MFFSKILQNDKDSMIDPKTGVYNKEYFLIRLKEERMRIERINLAFSSIFIDLSFVHSNDLTQKISKGKIYKIIADILIKNSREIDLKGWFDNGKMAILMPGTSYFGAETLCKKLIKLTRARFSNYLDGDIRLEDYFSIRSYPETPEDGNPKNESMLPLSLPPNSLNPSYKIVIQKIIKRLADIIGSLVGIILFLPAFIMIAIAIKLTSPGPIFFKQKRVGLNGRTFNFLKFRSMYHNCDQTVHQEHVRRLANKEITLFETGKKDLFSYKLQNDERVTKIGKFLRRTGLDELPQLFNVLKGEMSLVGPRPYPIYETENCIIWQHSRLTIKPGITGLAYLYARYNRTYTDAYRLDLQYIKKWSLWLDFKILVKTLLLVISGQGAQ